MYLCCQRNALTLALALCVTDVMRYVLHYRRETDVMFACVCDRMRFAHSMSARICLDQGASRRFFGTRSWPGPPSPESGESMVSCPN